MTPKLSRCEELFPIWAAGFSSAITSHRQWKCSLECNLYISFQESGVINWMRGKLDKSPSLAVDLDKQIWSITALYSQSGNYFSAFWFSTLPSMLEHKILAGFACYLWFMLCKKFHPRISTNSNSKDDVENPHSHTRTCGAFQSSTQIWMLDTQLATYRPSRWAWNGTFSTVRYFLPLHCHSFRSKWCLNIRPRFSSQMWHKNHHWYGLT